MVRTVFIFVLWQVCVRLLLVASLVPGLTITQVTALQVSNVHFLYHLYHLVYLGAVHILLQHFLGSLNTLGSVVSTWSPFALTLGTYDWVAA